MKGEAGGIDTESCVSHYETLSAVLMSKDAAEGPIETAKIKAGRPQNERRDHAFRYRRSKSMRSKKLHLPVYLNTPDEFNRCFSTRRQAQSDAKVQKSFRCIHAPIGGPPYAQRTRARRF